MQVKVLLQAKKDWGTFKKGDQLEMINDIFDENNGFAFYQLDFKQWEVISYDFIPVWINADKKPPEVGHDYIFIAKERSKDVDGRVLIGKYMGKEKFRSRNKHVFSVFGNEIIGLFYQHPPKNNVNETE